VSDHRPIAYDGFEGEVGRIFSTSTPSWPNRPSAPADAPNVIVMLVDDLGFSDLGCYGSEIRTPNVDALAEKGVRFANFHVNPMCSPTRASLLTGLNAHMAGVGFVAHSDPGFPGYAMELRPDAVTIADAFRASGWATFALGKWHLCKDSDLSDAGSKHSWPLQAGFDRYYGVLDGFTNLHQPHRLYQDNHVVEPDDYPDDYYLSDDLTDKAIEMVTRLRSSHPTKPFFMYFAHCAVHAPLHAKDSDIERYRGSYDSGWDEIRAQRFARQQDLGIVPPNAVLPDRPTEPEHEVRAWDDHSEDERLLFARYKETYAAMVDNIDQNLGRLRAHLEMLGEWDNTIVLFTSDNGASREGQTMGTAAYFRTLLGAARNADEDFHQADLAQIDQIGGPQTMPHYPRGWAMASNTPFRLYKVNAHHGGHQVPMVLSWPDGNVEPGIRHVYQHVTDVMATLVELAGAQIPDSRNGMVGPKPVGESFTGTIFDKNADSTHAEQYYESWGHRSFYRDGWTATTCHPQTVAFSDDRWELHDLENDPSQTTDLGDLHPERLAELVEAWETAAWANQVFPLDERSMLKETTRPPSEKPMTAGLTLYPGTPTLERYRSYQLIQYRSFGVRVRVSYCAGDEGVLFAHGDQGGGYSMYIDDGQLVAAHNGYGQMAQLLGGPVSPGEHDFLFSVEALAGSRCNIALEMDGQLVASAEDRPLLMAMAPFQGIDIGIDRRSPVVWDLYRRRGTFAYTGTLRDVTWEPGPPSPEEPTQFASLLREVYQKYE
jgi:arylsulfatase A-like enzyme